jgi:hypothetical protein
MHVVQNYDNDIMGGLAVADPPKSQIHFFLVGEIGGCRSYILLWLKWSAL